MKGMLFILGILAAAGGYAAGCSDGTELPTLIPPGPSDPGGPSQDGIGSSGPSTTSSSASAGTGGQGTTSSSTSTSTCLPDGATCVIAANCCNNACNSNVCGAPACSDLGESCGTCCDPNAACEAGSCCMPLNATCETDADCCTSAPNCVIGACST
jgi:hypothetical protein